MNFNNFKLATKIEQCSTSYKYEKLFLLLQNNTRVNNLSFSPSQALLTIKRMWEHSKSADEKKPSRPFITKFYFFYFLPNLRQFFGWTMEEFYLLYRIIAGDMGLAYFSACIAFKRNSSNNPLNESIVNYLQQVYYLTTDAIDMKKLITHSLVNLIYEDFFNKCENMVVPREIALFVDNEITVKELFDVREAIFSSFTSLHTFDVKLVSAVYGVPESVASQVSRHEKNAVSSNPEKFTVCFEAKDSKNELSDEEEEEEEDNCSNISTLSYNSEVEEEDFFELL